MSGNSPQHKDRVVRVFVSSTFRDMNAEREELGKFIFPELRKFCRERGVEFVEVDLRWGVTEEQSQRGETLAVCLAEIDHCRPYFIGLLGERYGWVPGEFHQDVVEGNPWLIELKDRSVTELEILHGVLNNPAMADRTTFYFRDPQYLDQVPAEQRGNFRSESEPAAAKLAALKQRIRQSGLPLVESYPDPHSAAVRIGDYLRRAIEAAFPAGEVRDPLAEDAAGHEIFAQSRTRVYIGREEDLARLDDFVTGAPVKVGPMGQPSSPPIPLAPPHLPAKRFAGIFASLRQRFSPSAPAASAPISSPNLLTKQGQAESALQPAAPDRGHEDSVLVILGPSGSGKSALLANWALHWRETHPDEFVFLHFLGTTPGSADYTNLLLRLLGALMARFGVTQDLSGPPDAIRKALREGLPNWLAMAAAQCSRLVLVLDGLNQLDDRDQAPDLVWLPEQFPPNVRVLVSTLPGRCLEALRQRPHAEREVQPLTQAERRHLINAYLGRYAKHLEQRRASRIASSEAAANPLYLRVLLDELRQSGSYEQLDARIEHYLQAKSIADLYEKVLERLEGDYERERPGLVKEALSLIWAARRGLTESELLELLKNVPRAVWSPLYLALEEALVERGGVISFFHAFLRQAVHDRYLPDAARQRAVWLRLADYFAQRGLDRRQVDEMPWLLVQVGEWQRLHERLADLAFLAAAWNADPYEVKTYWAQVEANSSLRKGDAYRRVLESPREYPDALWTLGILLLETGSPQKALGLFSHLVNQYRQTGDQVSLEGALGNLGVILKNRGDLDQALALFAEQERICRQLGNLDGLQRSLGNQADIRSSRGDLDGALALQKETERICRQLGNLSGLSGSLGDQGRILYSRGNLDGALALHKEEERICRRLGKLDGLSRSLGNQANILQSRGDLDGALALQKETERICRQLGDLDGLQFSLGNQAAVLLDRGDLDPASALFEEQEGICRQLDDLDGLQRSLGNQGVILSSRGDLDSALARFEEKERICRQLGNLDGLSYSLGNQGLILRARGDLGGALALQKETERICRELGNLDGLQRALGNQGNILYSRGDLDGALALQEEAEGICRKLGNAKGLAYALLNQASILKMQGKRPQALQRARQALELARQCRYGSLAGQIEGFLRLMKG